MTDTTDNAPASEARPEFDQLVFDLRALVKKQGDDAMMAKAEQVRRNATLVMQRASEMLAKGAISGAEYTRLHAVHLRLDAMIPLPGNQPPALDASALRPIDGDMP